MCVRTVFYCVACKSFILCFVVMSRVYNMSTSAVTATFLGFAGDELTV